MNLKKGFFRLTLVVSIIVAIMTLFLLRDRFRCATYEVKEEMYAVPITKDGVSKKEIAFNLAKQYHDLETISTFALAGFSYQEIIEYFVHKYTTPTATRTIKFKWDNISSTPKQRDFEEIFNKGLQKKEEGKIVTDFEPVAVLKPEYTILKLEWSMKWGELFLIGFISFASVWIIYALIRWVISGFIIGGFKAKS